MKISDFFTGGKVNSANLKTFARPLVAIVLIFIFAIVLIKIGSEKITRQIALLKIAKEEEALLTTKLSGLKEGSAGSLEEANKLVIALPEKNSAMLMISQFKKLSEEKSINIAKIEVSGLTGDEKMTSIQLLTQISSPDLNSLLAYLKTVPELAPISSVYSVRVTGQGDGFGGLIETLVYWSPFPSSIPSVREPITSLTEEEESIIEAIANLKAPDYQVINASEPKDREEPFN